MFTNWRFGWLVDRWLVRRSDSLCESKKKSNNEQDIYKDKDKANLI